MADQNVVIRRHNGSGWENIYPKTTASNIISGVLDTGRIPSLDASKVTSGTFDVLRIPDIAASKVTSGVFNVDRIPDIDADKVVSGVLDVARIPNMAADKIISGVFGAALIPEISASKITSGTLGVDRIPGLDASKITSGVLSAARLPAIAVTDVTVSTTMTTAMATYTGTEMQEGDILILTTDKETYIHNGGTAGTSADFTKLETPTDVVTSVAGQSGVVTLDPSDVGLSNVPNVDATDPANIVQEASYRFVTDAEKTTWNNKVDSLTDLGINATASEINKIDGFTGSVGDLNFAASLNAQATTATEFGYLSGVTSGIQSQINGKLNSIQLVDNDPVGESGDVAFVY